jgi:hypothetical protein
MEQELTLEQVLRRVVDEARSPDGIGPIIYTAVAVAEREGHRLAALQRIIAELRNNGVSRAALEAAEEALAEPLRED